MLSRLLPASLLIVVVAFALPAQADFLTVGAPATGALSAPTGFVVWEDGRSIGAGASDGDCQVVWFDEDGATQTAARAFNFGDPVTSCTVGLSGATAVVFLTSGQTVVTFVPDAVEDVTTEDLSATVDAELAVVASGAGGILLAGRSDGVDVLAHVTHDGQNQSVVWSRPRDNGDDCIGALSGGGVATETFIAVSAMECTSETVSIFGFSALGAATALDSLEGQGVARIAGRGAAIVAVDDDSYAWYADGAWTGPVAIDMDGRDNHTALPVAGADGLYLVWVSGADVVGAVDLYVHGALAASVEGGFAGVIVGAGAAASGLRVLHAEPAAVNAVWLVADRDGDLVADDRDNCPDDANADQLDADDNGVGDVCEVEIEDMDEDGLADEDDNCPMIPNADQSDVDDDGIGDVCDEDFGDRDNDGVQDDEDNCPDTANAGQVDTDRDGLGNACDPDDDNDTFYDTRDNCPLVRNISQRDRDQDGIGDDCDDDRDGDGVPNDVDNCPNQPNSGQLDPDGDGLGNECDRDDDGDNVDDGVDNCPGLANEFQYDRDRDGRGDACDNVDDPLPETDTDGDGVVDRYDNCRTDDNEDQIDIDGDGLGDACDADVDGDGTPDATDNCPRAANSTQADSDGDGVGDICDPTVTDVSGPPVSEPTDDPRATPTSGARDRGDVALCSVSTPAAPTGSGPLAVLALFALGLVVSRRRR